MGRGLQSVIFVLIVTLVVKTNAQVQCKDVFNIHSTPVTPQSVQQDVQGWVQSWWNLLDGKIQFPIVNIFLQPKSVATSYFMPAKNEIHLGVLKGKELASHLTRGAVLAHEFAHAIFTENFTFIWKGKNHSLKEVLEAARVEQARIESNPSLKELVEEVEEIRQTMQIAEKVKDKETQAELESLHLIKKQELEEKIPYLHLYEKIHQLTIAHNELFADSFPALFWKNPRMITEALNAVHLSKISLLRQRLLNRGYNKDANSEQRDFEITSFKDWKKELAAEYTLFDPVRGALWKLYMQNLKVEEIPLFMNVFLAATSRQVNLKLEKLEKNENFKMSPSELNREFLRIFVEEARRFGLPIRKH
jgi:hypothetical protein